MERTQGGSGSEKTKIVLPGSPSLYASDYVKRKARKNFGRRSAIDPVIGHLKKDFRLARSYFKGTIGDEITCFLPLPPSI